MGLLDTHRLLWDHNSQVTCFFGIKFHIRLSLSSSNLTHGQPHLVANNNLFKSMNVSPRNKKQVVFDWDQWSYDATLVHNLCTCTSPFATSASTKTAFFIGAHHTYRCHSISRKTSLRLEMRLYLSSTVILLLSVVVVWDHNSSSLEIDRQRYS